MVTKMDKNSSKHSTLIKFPVEYISGEELAWKVAGQLIVVRVNERRLFKGFSMSFSPGDIFPVLSNESRYLVACDNDKGNGEDIIGVLKLGTYNYFGTLPNYTAIPYIEVRDNRKKIGVATSLIACLDSVLTPNDFLVGTDLTPEGEKAKLDKKLNSLVTVCPYFNNKNLFYEYCKQNGLLPKKSIME